ncbi:MAG: aromatic amino acid ammonia-lyase [Candidatus Calescibacterium sp.]|nr:aromatic amino acid ammonia-lyase [Candidatus Calescibacterium sp.]MCX7972854.1 aromatic amino acid ammonia-lyase [bacterium]MDW8195224.1 aromatic amino acid ammonia-lyase [Candidatus Calescibacterium sp.]
MAEKTIQDSKESIRVELDKLDIQEITKIIHKYFEYLEIPEIRIEISESLKNKISEVRKKVDRINRPVYGINTGFGKLFDRIISSNDLEKLQYNLIYSHSAGYGKPVSKLIVFLTILIRLRQMSIGYSGVSLDLILHLVKMLENKDLPEIPCWTSVGASGDLIPLSHIFLKVLESYSPKTKESISFINGTSYSLANFSVGLFLISKLIEFSNFVLVLSSVANNINLSHFHKKLKNTKSSKYFSKAIDDLNSIIEKLEIRQSNNYPLQAPYSYRCYPQIFESIYGMYELCFHFADSELKSNTDNPLIIDDDFISAGNFHGNTISTMCDHLAVHIFQISNISFQRMNHILNPSFLTKEEGLNSGFMISQYLASHILTELKNLCYPTSIENFPVSLHQEDMVSYSENNSRKLIKAVYFCCIILCIEFLLTLQKIMLEGKKLNFKILNHYINNFYRIKLDDLLFGLPIVRDEDFKKFGSISGLQEKFIANNKIVYFIEKEFNS